MIHESIVLRGTYAKKIKELSSETKIRPELFDSYYKAYMFCAVYGLLNNKTAIYDVSRDSLPDEKPAEITSEVIMKHNDSYSLIRSMIILAEKTRGLTFEEKVDYALRFDALPENESDEYMVHHSKYNANTELIHNFALGGLNLFYQKVSEPKTPEDLIYFMSEFKKKFDESIETDDIQPPLNSI